MVPLAQRQALGIAVMSYDGHLGFGLLGDYDALPELELIAQELKRAIAALARAAGLRTRAKRPARRAALRPAGAAPAADGAATTPNSQRDSSSGKPATAG